MVIHTNVFNVDDVLNGYNDSHKLRNIYRDLRKEVLTSEPVQKSLQPLLTMTPPNWRGGNYAWELYDLNPALAMLEYYGSWTGYAHEANQPIPISSDVKEGDDYTAYSIRRLMLAFHGPSQEILDKTDKIIARYPRSQRKDSQMVEYQQS
jgi:hypothetical protein